MVGVLEAVYTNALTMFFRLSKQGGGRGVIFLVRELNCSRGPSGTMEVKIADNLARRGQDVMGLEHHPPPPLPPLTPSGFPYIITLLFCDCVFSYQISKLPCVSLTRERVFVDWFVRLWPEIDSVNYGAVRLFFVRGLGNWRCIVPSPLIILVMSVIIIILIK